MIYQSQAARDAVEPYGEPYADYLEQHVLELVARFPEHASHFLNQPLGEALAGNDGE